MASAQVEVPFQVKPTDVVSRDEWLAARIELLKKEKELTKAREAMAAARQQLPMVKIEKDYTFMDLQGKELKFIDLFEGRTQLIVYHSMFDQSWERGCDGCSIMHDNFPNLLPLHKRDTTLVAVSRALPEKIAGYREHMGWTFPWYSSNGSDFNYDFDVSLDDPSKTFTYNYASAERLHKRLNKEKLDEMPGISCFLRDGDTIYHTYSTYERGLDDVLTVNHFLDLTKMGRHEKTPLEGWTWHDKMEEQMKKKKECCR